MPLHEQRFPGLRARWPGRSIDGAPRLEQRSRSSCSAASSAFSAVLRVSRPKTPEQPLPRELCERQVGLATSGFASARGRARLRASSPVPNPLARRSLARAGGRAASPGRAPRARRRASSSSARRSSTMSRSHRASRSQLGARGSSRARFLMGLFSRLGGESGHGRRRAPASNTARPRRSRAK